MLQLILLDDEEEIRENLAHLFPWNEVGFRVAGVFGSARDALSHLQEHPVDAILCDICMPEMDGLKFIEQIRKIDSRTKVVILSGYPDFSFAQKAIALGVSHYLLKPTNYQKLRGIFQQLQEELTPGPQRETEAPEACSGYYEKLVYLTREYVRNELRTATLQNAADRVHISPFYLSKLFKDYSGSTFSDYLLRVRMERAAELLQDISLHAYEISEQVGYTSPKNFTRAFRNYFGMTPLQYRISGRGGERSKV